MGTLNLYPVCIGVGFTSFGILSGLLSVVSRMLSDDFPAKSDSPSRVLLQSFFEAVERLYHFRYFEHIGNSGIPLPGVL